MTNKATYLAAVFVIIGILFLFDVVIPSSEHIKQDAWIAEDPSKPPIGVLEFVFASKAGFFAGIPIHVKVRLWFTVGENYSDLAICFPDAYAYPRNQTPGKPPSAGWVPINKKDGFIGEGDIEFTQSGSFGYIVYSKGWPVYYAADGQIIQISPQESFLQMRFAVWGVGATFISIGAGILAHIIQKRRKETKIKRPVRKK